MTKFWTEPSRTVHGPRTPVVDRAPYPVDHDGACELYGPGHLMHYKHQGDAVRSPSLVVRDIRLDGTLVTLAVDGRAELTWRHHDSERLGRIQELLPGKGVAYPDHHALRIGPYWFNCAPESDDWQDCALSSTSRPA
jgi:hypothetical protein